MRLFDTASPVKTGRRDYFAIFDSVGELAMHAKDRPFTGGSADWFGNVTALDAVNRTLYGDESLVAESDKLLEQFEHVSFASTARIWADDVVGAVPNVPAFLAGVPCNMRRKRRDDSQAAAPLALIVDVSTSAAITAQQIKRRGAAILALTRILSARRPVELWCGTSGGSNMGGPMGATFVMGRLETAPLNLAQAAFVLSHPGFHRHLCYGIEARYFRFDGSWPYGAGAMSPTDMAKCMAPAFDHVSETLCMPGLHVADLSVSDPAAWVGAMVDKLTARRLEDA